MLTWDDFRAEEGLFTRAAAGGPQGQSRSPGLEWGPQPPQAPEGETEVDSQGGARGERPCPSSLPPLQSPIGAPTGQTQSGEGHWGPTDAVHTGRPPGARAQGTRVLGGAGGQRWPWAQAQLGSYRADQIAAASDTAHQPGQEWLSVAWTCPQSRAVSRVAGRRGRGG